MKSVLLTRAKEMNAELKASLSLTEIEILECNLINYELLPVNIDYIKDFSNILITSYFAAINAPVATDEFKGAFVVGEKSAKILAQKNYKILFCASNAEQLHQQILCEDNYGSTIYLSGNSITTKMPAWVTREVFYRAHYLEYFSAEQITRYKNGIDYVLLYSENSAKTLLNLLKENNLLNCLANSIVIVISSKVGLVVANNFDNIIISANIESMLNYVK